MRRFFLAAALLVFAACGNKSGVVAEPFGTLSDGQEVQLFTLVNSSGAKVSLSDYGARVVSIFVPGKDGKLDDVVPGPGDVETFEKGDRFMGCTIGRYGNRINHSSFEIDGVRYNLVANEEFGGEPVQCHGGPEGFDRFVWDSEPFFEEGVSGVRFHRLSPDGEQGYPGNCDVTVTYSWNEDNVLRIDYHATSDKPTVINLSNHTYFNMKGSKCGYVMDHLLQVESDVYVQNNIQRCPDSLFAVEGSPFDFRTPHRVDYRVDMPNKHLDLMKALSACWIIRDWDGSFRKACNLYDRGSGRGVEVWTTEPCLLTFTGRTFNGSLKGKYGPIDKYDGMILETIHAADSPNQDRFPSTVLRPGGSYDSTTEFRFFAK